MSQLNLIGLESEAPVVCLLHISEWSCLPSFSFHVYIITENVFSIERDLLKDSFWIIDKSLNWTLLRQSLDYKHACQARSHTLGYNLVFMVFGTVLPANACLAYDYLVDYVSLKILFFNVLYYCLVIWRHGLGLYTLDISGSERWSCFV